MQQKRKSDQPERWPKRRWQEEPNWRKRRAISQRPKATRPMGSQKEAEASLPINFSKTLQLVLHSEQKNELPSFFCFQPFEYLTFDSTTTHQSLTSMASNNEKERWDIINLRRKREGFSYLNRSLNGERGSLKSIMALALALAFPIQKEREKTYDKNEPVFKSQHLGIGHKIQLKTRPVQLSV